MNEKVSIIVAAYNASDYITDMLESVLQQTYQNWELIIVDDGSTDDTYKVCFDYQTKDERIQVHKTRNQGAIYARNIAYAKSIGKYIVILDADDIIYSNKLSLQVSILNGYGVDIVYGNIDRCDSNLNPMFRDSDVVNSERIGGDVFHKILCGNLFSVHAALFRKSVLTEKYLHPINIPIIADWELWARLSQTCKFIAHPELVGAYRMHNKMSARLDDSKFQLQQRSNTLRCFEDYPRYKEINNKKKSQIIFYHGRFAFTNNLYLDSLKIFSEGIRIYPLNLKLYIGLLLSCIKLL